MSIIRRQLGELIAFFIELVALCVPAIVNQSPIIFSDTRGYYLGGRAAIEKIESLLLLDNSLAIGSTLPLSEVRAVRSAFFALYEYITANIGTLWLSTAIQGVILLLLLRLAFLKLCPMNPRWHFTIIVLFLALLSTASWTVSYAMPDVFNSILALAMIAAAVFWERISRAQRLALMVAIAASVTMHTTNLLTACGLLIIVVLLRRQLWSSIAIGGAIVAGILALLIVGRVGFHEWTITPITPPFLTARAVADGPGRLYLHSACPQGGWVMCRYLARLNVNSDDFLWHDNGVYSAYDLTPEDRAAIRAEDKRLYVAITLAYPGLWLRGFVLNISRQLGDFTLKDHYIPSWATYTPTEMELWPKADLRSPASVNAFPESKLERVWDVALYATVLGSIIYLLILSYRRGLTLDQCDSFIIAMAATWLAALAGPLSDVSSRYEARAIWLIPAVAALVYSSRQPRRSRGESPTAPTETSVAGAH
jgi:hypothetical protein